MPPPDGLKRSYEGQGKALSDLQWAHMTLMHLIGVVQLNGLLTEKLGECVVELSKAAISLESVIQEHLAYARRRRDDEKTDC
jgi:hypothetical protein